MKQTSLDLHNLLHQASYDHAVICTYTFDPVFFEEYCLEKLNSLKNNGNISVIVDYGTYHQAITGSDEHKPKQANIRYLLHPIAIPGKFHVKLFLLVSKNKGRLIVGSANFTKPGITTNAEMVNFFDFEANKQEEFKYLFQAAFTFLNEISNKWPSNALASNLKSMEHEASWLVSENTVDLASEVTFLHNLEKPLWNQIISHVSSPVDSIHVLSRFFDSNPVLLDKVIKDLEPKKIKIFTQNVITTLTNSWLNHPLFKDKTLEIYCCNYMDEGFIQNLHAKAIAIIKGNRCLLAFGSANFTTPALFRVAEQGNAELLLLISELPANEIQPEKLFNPLENAFRLIDDGTLQTAPRLAVDSRMTPNRIVLQYAELVDNLIRIKMTLDNDLVYENIVGKIQFQNEAYQRTMLHHYHDDEFFTDTVESFAWRLGEASATMTIEAIKENQKIGESNPILIINLLDIKSGQHVRRERYIREAQKGVVDFFRVLENLIKEGDEQPLITFFNFCDIPIMDVSRPLFTRGMRPMWDGGMGMRSLGVKNLKIFLKLHEAALSFYTRHIKKLQRHVKNGGINGIANYLHIFLAMGGVLRSQVERLMQGLESSNNPISPDTWGQYRDNIDAYFFKFKELMSCLNDQYIPNLLNNYDQNALLEKFAPDLEPIKDLCSDMLAFQSRMEVLSKSSLKIKSQNGVILKPPFSKKNVFLPENWVRYGAEQENKMNKVLLRLAA